MKINVLKTKYLVILSATVMAVFCTLPARALPSLQLDIINGVYDGSSQTIVTTSDVFTLVAYGNPNHPRKPVTTSGDYFISIALTPMLGSDSSAVNFGSFIFGGTTYNMDDVVFGVPPIENALFSQPSDSGDLATHGMFPTLYAEFAFKFNASQTSASVNTQDTTGSDPVSNPGSSLYYQLFDVDISNLLDGYGLHFDLYNESLKAGDTDIDNFAPFSHDAESREVPEPGSLLLLGLGLLSLGFSRRNKQLVNQ